MDIKRYLKVMPVVAALLLIGACSNEENAVVEEPQPAQARIIPYTATVNSNSQTRATHDGIAGNLYSFQTGDQLYVWGENISGTLTLTSGAGETSASFSGNLTYTGDGDPSGDLLLNAVLKGPSDAIIGSFNDFKGRSYAPAYTTGIASSITDAVEKFSHFTASSLYEYKSFNPINQQSTFVYFEITLNDGTLAGVPLAVSITSSDIEVRTGSVTTVKDGDAIKAKFCVAFPGVYNLIFATVKLGDKTPILFCEASELYSDKIYLVAKTYE